MKISILSVGPPYRGGISEQASQLYSKLSETHDVNLINFKRQYPRILFPGKTQIESNPSTFIKKNHRIIDSINPYSWISTAKFIIKSAPDMMVIRFWNPFFSISNGYIIKKVKQALPKIKVIAICDNILPHERRFIDRSLIKYLFNKIDGFIVMSDKVENELLDLINHPRYKKTYHPVSFKENDIKKIDAREKLQIDKEKVILFFGFIRKYKGLDVLIKSTKYLNANLKGYKILICGECYENKEKYLNLISKHSTKDEIEWIDQYIPDELAKLYFSASDIIVLPYKSASQSGVIPLSYSYNKPVIASNIPGIKEMIDDGRTGYLFNSNDEKDLSEKIINFFNSKIDYEVNIKKFKQQFSWDNFIEELLELYKSI